MTSSRCARTPPTVRHDWARNYLSAGTSSPPPGFGAPTAAHANYARDDPYGFSRLPGPCFNDVSPTTDSDYELETIIDLVDCNTQVPDDTMVVVDRLDRLSDHLYNHFKQSTPVTALSDTDVDFVLQQLQAMLKYVSELCHRLAQDPLIDNASGPPSPPLSGHPHRRSPAHLHRSSYKFCVTGVTCTGGHCAQHHYALHLLHADILSVCAYIGHHRRLRDWDMADISKSVTTIYYVVSHIQHEYQVRRTIAVYNDTISSSNNLHTQPVNDPNADGDWIAVTSARSTHAHNRTRLSPSASS